MKNFKQRGETINVPAPADTKSGDGVLVGSLFGIACFDADSGQPLEIDLGGCFELRKTNAQAWTVGQKIYWDAENKHATTGATGNSLIGAALEAAPNPSPYGVVRLDGVAI